MKKIGKQSLIFCSGAAGYCLLELIWRGRTHWSMAAAGGMSLLLLNGLFHRLRGFSLMARSAAGGGVITGVELVFGLIFNRILHLHVWDYSAVPGKFSRPDLSALFFLLVSALRAVALLTERAARRKTLPGA